MDNFVAHILVVDDDEGIRTLVKKYLNENNYLVTTANSAEDAFEKIQIIKFDLIILDIMMPGKSGLEFIKENQKKLDTPVILLTAKGEADERVEGLEVGADDYLPKPFEPKELLLRIQNIIRKTKKSDQKRVIQFENIKIDLNKQLIIKKNTEYKINNTEKKILLNTILEEKDLKILRINQKFEFKAGKEVKIATKYPNIASEYFKKKKMIPEIIYLNGSVELAPLIGLSDVIVDITETGETIRKNNLKIIDTVMNVAAKFIVNKRSYRTLSNEIQSLSSSIKK